LRVEGAVLQHGPDLLEEQLVREGRLGPPPGGHFPERRAGRLDAPGGVDRRACHPPDRADQGERIALARRGAYELSDRLSLFTSSMYRLFLRRPPIRVDTWASLC